MIGAWILSRTPEVYLLSFMALWLGGYLFSMLFKTGIEVPEGIMKHTPAIVVGFAGIVLLIGPSVLANAGDQVLGIIVTFCAPLSHTLGAIYARKQGTLPPPVMTVGQMVFGGAILTPLAFGMEAPLSLTPSLEAIGAIIIASVFCTAIAMSLYFVVIRRIGAARSSLVPLFFPVVAVILGAVALGEQLPFVAFVGLACILCGAIAVSARAPAKSAAPAK